MGGLLILLGIVGLDAAVDGLVNRYVWACLLVTAGFGLIGFPDDYDKVARRPTPASRAGCGCVAGFLIALAPRPG